VAGTFVSWDQGFESALLQWRVERTSNLSFKRSRGTRCLTGSAGLGGGGCNSRIVAPRPGQGLLSDHVAAAQPWRRERVFVPLTGHLRHLSNQLPELRKRAKA